MEIFVAGEPEKRAIVLRRLLRLALPRQFPARADQRRARAVLEPAVAIADDEYLEQIALERGARAARLEQADVGGTEAAQVAAQPPGIGVVPAGEGDFVPCTAHVERGQRELAHFDRMIDQFGVVARTIAAEAVFRRAGARHRRGDAPAGRSTRGGVRVAVFCGRFPERFAGRFPGCSRGCFSGGCPRRFPTSAAAAGCARYRRLQQQFARPGIMADGLHQQAGTVEETMFRIEMRPAHRQIVRMEPIADLQGSGTCRCLPGRLVDLRQRDAAPRCRAGVDRDDVTGEFPDQVAAGCPRRHRHALAVRIRFGHLELDFELVGIGVDRCDAIAQGRCRGRGGRYRGLLLACRFSVFHRFVVFAGVLRSDPSGMIGIPSGPARPPIHAGILLRADSDCRGVDSVSHDPPVAAEIARLRADVAESRLSHWRRSPLQCQRNRIRTSSSKPMAASA